jgi:hypothetical protein
MDALKVLKTPSKQPALSLMAAVEKLTDGGCCAWEFDTTFEHLKKEHDIELDSKSADTLMAVLSARANPSFLWDVAVFQALVQSLNGEEAITGTYVQCSPGECASAVMQLEELGRRIDEDFSRQMYNDDCRIYIAGCCIADGLVCLPEYLSFCDEEAKRMLNVSQRLSESEIKKIRSMASRGVVHTDDDMDSENPLEVLLRKHHEVRSYLDHTRKRLLTSS